ncbi:uncharacterized protein PHACADRAFT_208459 [Phanerochaete carnosa HHB-10118-sp]|uniref:Uncharacterized protein n=1 Tax=Phanerochaete carnosa (strain HHB-10118-sp) TaxID=650164 RepID=K5WEB0_PHACS|nr:uncharacterized protein PHACADRAFT_208459 [Phanerochaete carnosa HHB-10118-sp]EKM57389.1 hypothetical protein PHACADRAFT_208459 [Phanerochaete carnosa HHB-10118-sp]
MTSTPCVFASEPGLADPSVEKAKAIYAKLCELPAPLFHAPSPACKDGLDPALQPAIADLLLHPALEAAFHLLNHALYPAHFLVRKMQNARAGQHLHGILHRVEGDYDNARVWYVEASGLGERTNNKTDRGGEDAFVEFWSSMAGLVACEPGVGGAVEAAGGGAELARNAAIAFIERVQRLKENSKGQVQDAGAGKEERRVLEQISKAELEAVVEWAAREYGWGTWHGGDGSASYTESTEEQKEEMRRQQHGGEGFRQF